MKMRCTALAGLLGLAFLLLGGGSSRANAAVTDCTNGSPGPNMTIVIYNNSNDYNIYPVLFAGAPSSTDQWMQACFKINQAQLADHPYPRASQYRMYVNCCGTGENGIPPGGSVTITLPFYSPLVQQLDPKGTAQFIDWWQGGGINVYQSPNKPNLPPPMPPAILQSHWTDDANNNRGVSPNSNPPACSAGCNLHFFIAPSSIANWEPQQLIEYTLGAAPQNTQISAATDPFYLWVPDNVDYDVSNVNYAYMPAAIEPYGNTLINTCCAIGWVGSTAGIDDVTTAINNWLASPLGANWPVYVDQSSTTNPKATVPGKVPSALEIFLNYSSFNNTNNYSPAPSQSMQITLMKTLWEDCTSTPAANYTICSKINDVTRLIRDNYNNYTNVFQNDNYTWTYVWKCTAAPVTINEQLLLAHLYGWAPFNADSGCSATANLLEQTPGHTDPASPQYYATVKAEYDQLQYWKDVTNGDYGQWSDKRAVNYGQFDPYVALVHGKDYMDAPYTYAYSVDDAVGNMQTDGTGLIIAVGGPQNLPNPNHVTPEVLFTFGYSSPYQGGITFDQYGRCVGSPDTATVSYFTTFVVPRGIDGASNSVINCQVTLVDSRKRQYTFKLKQVPANFPTKPNPPPAIWPTTEEIQDWNPQFIDCSGNTDKNGQTNPDVLMAWCQNIFVYQQQDLTNPHLPTRYYVIMPGPAPCDRDPSACNP